MNTETEPVGWTRTLPDSYNPARAPSDPHHRRRRDPARLDEGRNPYPAALSARRRFFPPGLEAVPVGGLERQVQRGVVVAHVVLERDGRLVGELADEVLAPELDAVHPEFPGGLFDQPFQQVGGLGASRAAQRVDRHRVGEERLDLDVDRGGCVRSREEDAVQVRRDAGSEGGQVRAQVGFGGYAQPQEGAVRGKRHLGRADVVAAVGVRLECVETLAGPLDGPAELPGGPGQDRLLRVVRDLRSEAAAHVGRHDPQLVLREAEDEGAEEQPGEVGVLARCVECVFVRRWIEVRDGRARLDCVGDEAIVHHIDRDYVFRAFEGRVGGCFVADLPVVADVAGRVVEDQSRAIGLGCFDRGHRRKLLVVHIHQVGRRLGLLHRVGHDDGDAVTHVAYLAQRERRMRRFDHG